MGLTAVIVASCAGLTWSRCWSWSVVRHPDKVALRPTADAGHPAPLVAAYAESVVWRCGAPPGRRGQDASGCDVNRGLEPAELWSVAGPVHVMGADDDVVTLERTLALDRGLPDAQLAIIPADPPRRACRPRPRVWFSRRRRRAGWWSVL